MTCRQCAAPLARPHRRYCSRACYLAAVRLVCPPRACATCGAALTRSQIVHRQRHCSVRCAPHGGHTPVMQAALLALLGHEYGQGLTIARMAMTLYGFADAAECGAVRQLLYGLRRRGYRFEARPALWLDVHGCTKAYRLVEEPTREEVAS